MPLSLDEQSYEAAVRIADVLDKADHWSRPDLPEADSSVNISHAQSREEFIKRWVLSEKLARDTRRTELAQSYKLVDPTAKYEQLVTLSFDKKGFRPDHVRSLVNSLSRKCPKVLDYDSVIVRPEFNATDSTDPSFNPHVHIVTTKVVKDSAVVSALNKRFITCKKPEFPIYNVNVVQAPYPSHRNYCLGLKSSSEKKAKMECDTVYRDKNNLSEYYYLGRSATEFSV